MNRREFCTAGLTLPLIGCGAGAEEMGQEFTLQPSPTRSANFAHSDVPGYAEGVWTPAISFGTSSAGTTYLTQSGKYTKLGNLVTVAFRVTLTSKGAQAGTARIDGLPFTIGNYLARSTTALWWANMTTALVNFIAVIEPNGTSMVLYGAAAAAASLAVITDADFSNTTDLEGGLSYYALQN